MTEELIVREGDGTFKKGVSGNPAGRPKGQKHELTTLRNDLEIAVRKALPAARIIRIVEEVAKMAEAGNLRAAKLILDKTISNAAAVEDAEENKAGGITIRIENATFAKTRETPAVEAEFTEVNK
jgi:hypothetical protein